jgi:hypothetical protein
MELSYSFLLKTDLSKYVGKWVAIVDEKVVAADINAKKAYKKAKLVNPDKEPLLDKVYGDKTMIV